MSDNLSEAFNNLNNEMPKYEALIKKYTEDKTNNKIDIILLFEALRNLSEANLNNLLKTLNEEQLEAINIFRNKLIKSMQSEEVKIKKND